MSKGPGRYTTMTLDAGEFIRRFLIHVLPKASIASATTGLFAGRQAPRHRDERANCWGWLARRLDRSRRASMPRRRRCSPSLALAVAAECASSRSSRRGQHAQTPTIAAPDRDQDRYLMTIAQRSPENPSISQLVHRPEQDTRPRTYQTMRNQPRRTVSSNKACIQSSDSDLQPHSPKLPPLSPSPAADAQSTAIKSP